MARVVVFGATGYTGELTAQRLASTPAGEISELVLAGRNRSRLEQLAQELTDANPNGTPPSIEVADIASPPSVRRLVSDPDDALVSTVGPFTKWGRPAVEAAISAGCFYVDSTGEPPFIRHLFEVDNKRAQGTGARLVPAFGYDYVPGNLAGTLAIQKAREAGDPAVSVDVGYFMAGPPSMSSGTATTGASLFLEGSYSFSDGKIKSQRLGRHVRSFRIYTQQRDGFSIGGTEQFALPNLDSKIRNVDVYIGAAGSRTKLVARSSAVASVATHVPGVKRGLYAVAARTMTPEKGGPDQGQRNKTTTIAVAQARNAHGETVADVMVEGPSPYDLTADLLAWAARHGNRTISTGTLGPTDAFGADQFVAGCAELELHESP